MDIHSRHAFRRNIVLTFIVKYNILLYIVHVPMSIRVRMQTRAVIDGLNESIKTGSGAQKNV